MDTKPIYSSIFTNNIWSYLLSSSVIGASRGTNTIRDENTRRETHASASIIFGDWCVRSVHHSSVHEVGSAKGDGHDSD